MSNRPLKLFALAGLFAATLSGGAMAADGKPSFVSSGSFQVCSDPTFPPLEFFEKTGDREPSGFDADLIRALAKHWGVKPRFIVTEFTGLLPGLDAKRCDAVISGTLITPERIQKLNAVAYLSSATIVFGSGKIAEVLVSPGKTAVRVVTGGFQFEGAPVLVSGLLIFATPN